MAESTRETATGPSVGTHISKDMSSYIAADTIRKSKYLDERFITDLFIFNKSYKIRFWFIGV